MAKCILFDLDGTLTDSGEGIINCAILGLEYFGLPTHEIAGEGFWSDVKKEGAR